MTPAGWGTRLRPHTWSKPKPLVSVAGKPVLSHILDSIVPLHPEQVTFVTGYLGEQIREHVEGQYGFTASFVHQSEMRGQAHAIRLARNIVQGPVLIAFADTIFATDISILDKTDAPLAIALHPDKLRRDTPRHRRTPVMPDQVRPLCAAGIDQCANVLDELGYAIVTTARRAGTACIAPLIRRQATVSLCGQPSDDFAPAGIELRETMQQHDDRPVGRSRIDDVEDKIFAAVLIHAFSMPTRKPRHG